MGTPPPRLLGHGTSSWKALTQRARHDVGDRDGLPSVFSTSRKCSGPHPAPTVPQPHHGALLSPPTASPSPPCGHPRTAISKASSSEGSLSTATHGGLCSRQGRRRQTQRLWTPLTQEEGKNTNGAGNTDQARTPAGPLPRGITCTRSLKQNPRSPLGPIIISMLPMKKLKAKTITQDHTARKVGSCLCHPFTQRIFRSEGWKGPELTQSTPLRVQIGKLRPGVTQGMDG